MSIFPNNKQLFSIIGPAGKLELLTAQPRETETKYKLTKPIIAIVCHPHPVHGGTMHNKVVYTLASALNELGCKTVRFNFRGVQNSTGEFDNAVGELADLLAVVDWVKSVCPNDNICLAGFSFGSYITIKACSTLNNMHCLISVAPPVGQSYFIDLPEIHCPWLMCQGEQDEIIEPQLVYDWVAHLAVQPKLITFPDTGHFFHQKLVALKQTIMTELNNLL